MAVGVKDVARAAGVSLGTVSNVLNRPEMVREATRVRVEQVMTELGYVRNEGARQLRAGRSRAVAYIVIDLANPFFSDVAHGIEDGVEGSDLALYTCNSGHRATRESTYLDRLEEQRVQGILITPVDPEARHLDSVASRGTPIVLVDRRRSDDSLCSVSVDDVLGGRLAMDHLLELGHSRIAFVGGPSSIGQVADRLQGAREALEAHGDATALRVVATDAMTVEEGRRAGERIAGIRAAERPTAAFCANDLVALGLLQQCTAMGVRVPDDLAIVGYDDIDFAGAAAVPLTSVRQPGREIGRAAAELLAEESADPGHEHRQIVFTPELMARASTRGSGPVAPSPSA